jgi:transcriptional regulator with XRE-family HTH domain
LEVRDVDIDGDKLRRLRLRKAWTLREMHDLTGVAYDTIHRIEQGKQRPRQITVKKLAQALGVPPEALMSDRAEDAHQTP